MVTEHDARKAGAEVVKQVGLDWFTVLSTQAKLKSFSRFLHFPHAEISFTPYSCPSPHPFLLIPPSWNLLNHCPVRPLFSCALISRGNKMINWLIDSGWPSPPLRAPVSGTPSAGWRVFKSRRSIRWRRSKENLHLCRKVFMQIRILDPSPSHESHG